jgi:hypothetical protein
MREATVTVIKDWADKAFIIKHDGSPRTAIYCCKIMITHIAWGNDDEHSLQLKVRNRLESIGRYGTIRDLKVRKYAKRTGVEERDTIAFLQYNDIESHWYAIARFNDVFVINNVACCYRPAAVSVRLDDYEGYRVECNYAQTMNRVPRNLYVERYGVLGYQWCCLCSLCGEYDEMVDHWREVHGRGEMMLVSYTVVDGGSVDRRGVYSRRS